MHLTARRNSPEELTWMLTPFSVIGSRDSHLSLHSGFPGFPTAHCFNLPIKLCSFLWAKIVCPVALPFTWSKRILQIVALGRRWQLLCNRFSRFLLDLDGWGCHLDSISSTQISHWPLWAAFGAHASSGAKRGCLDLHLPFRGLKGCCEEICVTLAGQFTPEAQQCTSPFYIFESRSKECIRKKYFFAPYSRSKAEWALSLS